MKRRLTSAALALIMAATAVTAASCGQEDNLDSVGEDKIANATTLNIWGIKGEGTTDEAIAAVEKAMSEITQAQFNTAIKLELYTEAEYDKMLEKRMDEIQEQLDKEEAEAEAKKQAAKEAKKNGGTDTTTAEESTDESTEIVDETILDEYGLPETFYPDVEDTQLDIFLITDYDMLMKYSEKEVLSPLDESLSSSSKLLKSYIHPTLLAAGKINGSTYAILNNHPVGEYTFMLLNKELMDKYYYDADDFKSFNDAVDFMLEVGNDTNVTPFEGDISPIGVHYFTADGSESVVGNMLDPAAELGTNGGPKNLLSISRWKKYLIAVKQLEEKGYIGSETIKEGDNFACGIIKGTYADVASFEDNYYINVIQNPQATTENVYEGMFAVSKYTKSLSRSMEIITYLNTRSDLRNLFAYGIEGVNYELDKEGVVKKLNNDYNMKLEYTGNMFVAYPPEGSTPDIWENAKQQNLDMVKSPYFGFTYDESKIDPKLVSGVKSFSDRFFSALNNQTAATIEDFLAEWWDTADADTSIKNFIASKDSDETDEYEPMGKIYADWYAANAKTSEE